MGPKKIPLRRCNGCGEMKPKKELIRVILTPDGMIELDLTGKTNGRGAYVCRDEACFAKARKAKAIERDFPLEEVPELLQCPWHEVRLCGLLLLVSQFERLATKRLTNDETAISGRDKIVKMYKL